VSEIEYIEIPIETDPEALAQEAFDYVQANIAGWVPNDANLETIIIEACARMIAEARDVAGAVPNDIFRYFGKLVGILPQEASYAAATSTWNMIDTAGYTIPADTQVGIRTTGDTLVPFRTVEDVVIAPASNQATGVIIEALEPGEDSSGLVSTLPLELIDTLDFVDSIDLTSDTTGGVDAETDDSYLNRLTARLQMLTDTPILPRDFAVMAQDIAGVARATAIDNYNPEHNKLTDNMSTIINDIVGWAADINCTLAKDNTQASHGASSLRMRSSASGNMAAKTMPDNLLPVVAGAQVTGIAEFKAATTGRSCRLGIDWLDASQAFINTSEGTNVSDTTLGWTQAFVAAKAPYNAAFMRLRLIVASTGAANEDHFVDKMGLRNGYSLNWVLGGTAELNNERMVSVAVVDDDGQPLSAPVKQEVDDYLQSLRETNFIVHVIDGVYTSIDVTFTAVARLGYDAATAETAAEDAVEAYLSPANWGIPETAIGDLEASRGRPLWENKNVVRYLELAEVINEVPSIDYITTLQLRMTGGTLGTSDVTIGGAAPLPQPGTITGTVT
jgi:hypothetical protein